MAIMNNHFSRLTLRVIMQSLSFCGLILTLMPTVVLAQVSVIPNTPPYNIQVLPGSTRQINVNITGGSSNTVNWSVLSATGGASATFTTPAASGVAAISAGIPTVQVNIGPGTGNCTIPQMKAAAGTYTVTSTAAVTIQAQSVDDPTKTGTFLFNVCAKTTSVMAAPAYQQAFMGQHRTVQSWVSGDVDETGVWSIVAQPSGGDAVLADTTNRDTDFVATVTGRYTLQYTSNSNSSKSATAIVYVSPNPLPAYAATPNKTEPRECYVDPQLAGGDYEVGAGKQYAMLQSTPAANTIVPGSIIRVWNTDTTGSYPSTFNEYYQITANGTPTQPIILCGVPDSLGNLPVIDGSNATAQAGVSTGAAAGMGVVSLWAGGYGKNTPYSYWQSGAAGPNYISVTGLHIAHGTPNFSYTPPGGGAALPYGAFTSCLNIRSGSYIDLSGNDLDTCGLGIFTAENGNSAWAPITQLVTITGSHIENAGISGQSLEHGAYFQSWYALMQGNLVDNYNPLASGSAIKWRGVEGIFRYNNVASGAARLFDLVEEQDSPNYITFESYLGLPGDFNCNDSMYCLGDNAGPNVLAGYQESFQKDFIYGNELFGASAQQQIHYSADVASGMEDRNGTLYFYSNTLDAAQRIFDTGENGDGFNGYFPQRIDARNNIFWASVAPYKGAMIQMAFGTDSTLILSATTNLMKASTFSIQTPILGAPWSQNTQIGWSNACDATPCLWPLSIPLDQHLYGLSNANFLTTATQPYDPTTLIPLAGSAAIDTGTTLSGILQAMPVRWQYSIPTNSLTPRLNPQTIGALDYSPEADAPTFTPAPGQYTTAQTVTIATTTPSTAIYFTTDGSFPATSATGTTQIYAGPITVSATQTVQAIATATGFVQSPIAVASYGIGSLAGTPSFSMPTGTYTGAQTVALSDSTPGATIYFTTDGSTPSSSSTVYAGPIVVSASETVQAIAAAVGYSNSNIASAAFAINLPQTVTPTFTPAAGTYTSTQTVSISDATAGAVIYYTTDGSIPTSSSSVYTGPLTVAASETIEAIAFASGDSPSAIASAAYAITVPFVGPAFAQQCNKFVQYGTNVSCTLTGVGDGHTLVIGTSNMAANQAGIVTSTVGTPTLAVTDGSSLAAWILPNTSSGSITISYTLPASTRLWLSVAEYANTAIAPLDGTAQANLSTIWQNGSVLNTPALITTSASDVLWSFCSGTGAVPTVGLAPVAWSALPTPTNGSLLVENGNAINAGSYYGQCIGNEGEIVSLALMPPSGTAPPATPTFSLASGSFTSAQIVTISDSTPGATIYYTTDGTVPTTSSAAYSGPITVSTSQTLEAVAVASSSTQSAIISSSTQSAVASAVYTITALPSITWATPTAINYQVALSATQLNATASVSGTFTYSPGAGAVLKAGNQTLAVTFTPTDLVDFSPTTATVILTVNKSTPVVTWGAPAAITFGTALSSAQLNATSNVAGIFAYLPTSGTVLKAGTQTLTVTFIPTDTVDYNNTSATTPLLVNLATPVVTWGTPAAIAYGTALSATQLNATSALAGSFTYSPALGTVLNAGSQTLSATFTPTDTTDFSAITKTVILTISKVTPKIVWGGAAATTYGTGLSATQLNATSTIPGTFAYSPALGTILNAGSQTLSVTFTPTNATNYNASTATVSLTVSKATPTIVWNAPIAIAYGTPLSSSQLNATSTVSGTFTYSPVSGTVLASGSQTLTTTFTPSNSANYLTAKASVTLVVNKPPTPPTFVQQCNQFMQYGATSTCTLNGVGAGHTLVIGIAGSGTQSGTITSSVGKPTLAVKDGSLLSTYILANTSAGTITITFNAGSSTRIYLTVSEYANTNSSPLDGIASFISKVYGTTVSTPNFTTTSPMDTLWSYCVAPSGYTFTTSKLPISWTSRTAPTGAGYSTFVEDGPTNLAGTYYGQCSGAASGAEIVTIALKP